MVSRKLRRRGQPSAGKRRTIPPLESHGRSPRRTNIPRNVRADQRLIVAPTAPRSPPKPLTHFRSLIPRAHPKDGLGEYLQKSGPKLWPQLGLCFQERERGFEPPTSSLGMWHPNPKVLGNQYLRFPYFTGIAWFWKDSVHHSVHREEERDSSAKRMIAVQQHYVLHPPKLLRFTMWR